MLQARKQEEWQVSDRHPLYVCLYFIADRPEFEAYSFLCCVVRHRKTQSSSLTSLSLFFFLLSSFLSSFSGSLVHLSLLSHTCIPSSLSSSSHLCLSLSPFSPVSSTIPHLTSCHPTSSQTPSRTLPCPLLTTLIHPTAPVHDSFLPSSHTRTHPTFQVHSSTHIHTHTHTHTFTISPHCFSNHRTDIHPRNPYPLL